MVNAGLERELEIMITVAKAARSRRSMLNASPANR
jgi:hypothetical protein